MLESKSSIISNTIWIFLQRLLSAVIGLITTPIILSNLGISDFGIYSASIGLIGIISFVSWSLSTATQKYFATSYSKNNKDDFLKVFNSSLAIHVCYGLIILISVVVIAFNFLNSVIQFPNSRFEVVQCIVLIVGMLSFLQMVLIPLLAVLRVSENFKWVSRFGMLENIFKLGATFGLSFIYGDKLFYYGIMLLSISVLVVLFHLFYIIRTYQLRVSFSLIILTNVKGMLSFTGWNMLSALAMVGRNQGIIVLLNLFFGVVVSAAWGIAGQIQSALNVFIQSIVLTTSPRILKGAGAKNFEKMISSANQASKYGLFIILIFCIPLYFSLDFVLECWLKEVPEYTALFVKGVIIFFFVNTFSLGIQSIFQGIDKVKQYNIFVSSLLILNLPLAYFAFMVGFPPFVIIYISAILEFFSFLLRLVLMKKYFNFQIIDHFKRMIKNFVMPLLMSVIFSLSFKMLFDLDSIIMVLFYAFLNAMLIIVWIYKFALDHNEKIQLRNQIWKFNVLK